MKRWVLYKTGTVILSTAAGFCLLPSQPTFGQASNSAGSEIQRRLAEMYARDGKQMPAMDLESLPSTLPNGQQPAMPQQRQQQQQQPQNRGFWGRILPHRSAPQVSHQPSSHQTIQHFQQAHQQQVLPQRRTFPQPIHQGTVQSNPPQAVALPQTPAAVHQPVAGVRAPITGTTPELSTADLVQEKPQIVPRPLDQAEEPAPPVPCIKPAAKPESVASKVPTQPVIVPRADDFPQEIPLSKVSISPKSHPLVEREENEKPSFEMPVVVHPNPETRKPKTGVVLAPPIEEPEHPNFEPAFPTENTARVTPARVKKPESIHPFAEQGRFPKAPPKPVARQNAARPAAKSPNPFEAFASSETPQAEPSPKQGSPKPAVSLENPFEPFSPKPAPKTKPASKQEASKPAPKLGNPFEIIQSQSSAKSEPQAAAQMPAPSSRQQPAMLPAGPSRALGMEGCCPVTLRDRRVMVPGKAEYTTVWEGVTYRFASTQAQAEFQAQPANFAPAKAGRDVILLATSGQQVPGSLEHAVWYHRRLYLFQSPQTMEAFSANPEKYITE